MSIFKAIQRIVRRMGGFDIVLAILLTVVLFPWSLIFWIILVLREMD